jgi:hypothetical protein
VTVPSIATGCVSPECFSDREWIALTSVSTADEPEVAAEAEEMEIVSRRESARIRINAVRWRAIPIRRNHDLQCSIGPIRNCRGIVRTQHERKENLSAGTHTF